MDIVEEGNPRAKWIESAGGRYINGKAMNPLKIGVAFGPMDRILDALALDEIIVLTDIPGKSKEIQINGQSLIREMVLTNQIILGRVNAAEGHFEMGVNDLPNARRRYPGLLRRLITSSHSFTDFKSALGETSADEITRVAVGANAGQN